MPRGLLNASCRWVALACHPATFGWATGPPVLLEEPNLALSRPRRSTPGLWVKASVVIEQETRST